MATRGRDITKPATDNDAAPRNKTSPEEPWATASGEMYKERVWQDLRNLFQQDELTDVMLAAEGQSIPCHKVLLAAASKFFHDKFVVNPESLEHNLLDIEDVDFDTLTSVVSFIYDGRAQLTVEKTEKLIPASVSLMLPELTNMCRDFLFHTVDDDASACIAIHRIAKANSLADVEDKAWQVMLEKFQELSGTEGFKEMSETELQEYIGDKQLNVASEDPVFEALVTWVNHDLDNRKLKFDSLLEHITLSHCSPAFLGDVVRNEPLINSVTGLQCLADAWKDYHSRHCSVQEGTARQGYKGDAVGNTLFAIFEDQYWTLKDGEQEWVCKGSSSGKMLHNSSACLVSDGIWVIGGLLDGKFSSQCWKLSLPTLNWTAMPDLNVECTNHVTVCVGNQVYRLGGQNTVYLRSVEYLEEQSKSWHAACDMTTRLAWHTAVNYKGFVYVFGGQRGAACPKETYVLDTVNQKWSKKANMPVSCSGGSSVVYGDRIYVMGGTDNCCISYNPDQDQWKTHSKHAVRHNLSSAVVWKDRILLCGGQNTSVIEEYNPDTDTWSQWTHQLPKYQYTGSLAVFVIHT